MSPQQLSIFYSWQSDCDEDCNNRAIRQALTEAIPSVEQALPSVQIRLDEATRDRPGSPNIPATIFEKISNADIFVCDITTINAAAEGRKTPNPNVLIELGYAIAVLGWSRIVLVFNQAFGSFPQDAPFDIDRHRITTYSMASKTDTGGKGNLRATLIKAIRMIVDQNPPRGNEAGKEASSVKKKNVDVRSLKQILSTIHLPTMDAFLERAPQSLDVRIIHYYDTFHALFNSASFHLFDKDAYELLKKIDRSWSECLSNSHSYHPTHTEHIQKFGSAPGNWIKTTRNPKDEAEREKAFYELKEREEQELQILTAAARQLRQGYQQFLEYIKGNYLEIDLDETNRAAQKGFQGEN